jgi:hypothetical protein
MNDSGSFHFAKVIPFGAEGIGLRAEGNTTYQQLIPF